MSLATYISGLTDSGATPALEATMQFVQARHRVIAENVANLTTPGYKAKRLDRDRFQQVLSKALESHGGPREPLVLDDGEMFRTDENGGLRFVPSTRPGKNAVFHDGTNVSIEREMSELASNAMLNEMASTMLKGNYESIRKAIRGRS